MTIDELETENKALQEKISELRGIIQRLGDDAEKSQIKKDELIIENNNLRGLVKDSIYIINEYKHYFDVKHYNMAENIINNASEVLK